MTFSDYHKDGGYKSRKYTTIILAVLLNTGACITWAATGWNPMLLQTLTDTITTLTLGYCGISSLRSAVPATTSSLASKLTKTTTTQQQQTVEAKTASGSKEGI